MANTDATLPEVRLDVAEPDLDIGNVETVLETLRTTCYYMNAEGNRYRFSMKPNLNKLVADQRASVKSEKITERVRATIQKVFARKLGEPEVVFFPEASSHVPDRPSLLLVVMAPERSGQDSGTRGLIDTMTREHGSAGRTFKSGLIWAVPEDDTGMNEEARRALAWEALQDEREDLHLDQAQMRQLEQNLGVARRDLVESVWRAYKNIWLLGKDNGIRHIDLGLVHSGAAPSPVALIVQRLRADGEVVPNPSAPFLVRNWPPAFKEWSTRAVRDVFFASPQFPRILDGDTIRDTIARGVSDGFLAYVARAADGSYDPFIFGRPMSAMEVEISDDVFVITRQEAESYKKAQEEREKTQTHTATAKAPADGGGEPVSGGSNVGGGSAGGTQPPEDAPPPPPPLPTARRLRWSGVIAPQKWMVFYTKVLTRFVLGKGLNVTIALEVNDDSGISEQKIEETKIALQELGLSDQMEVE